MNEEQLQEAARTRYVVFRSPNNALGETWVALDLPTGKTGLDVDPEGALRELLTLL